MGTWLTRAAPLWGGRVEGGEDCGGEEGVMPLTPVNPSSLRFRSQPSILGMVAW